ncbi:MAG: rRNA pseudouridine synthase [Candidatus Gracilibacteria bacterium]|nr:rRNA pseudouridine synthase [Candidatus Gracilibacteria bacterium]
MEENLRIHKYLSQSGICSRRKAEEYIKDGLITVNGKIAEIGQTINPKIDKVKLLDKAVKAQSEYVYYKVNKPRGVVTTCASIGEKTILDIIDIDKRVFPIGRLDKETDGLILLTNDGRLANFLMHPRYNHSKQYMVETFGPIKDDALQQMRDGLFILGSYTKKAEIDRISSGKFLITITEGRNRQIRRMVEKVGGMIKRLRRVRIENIELGNLEVGEYKPLNKKELDELFKKLEIPRG